MSARLRNPRLLATTNTRREGPPQPFTNREVVLCVRASHPIVPVWENTLVPSILDVIADMKIPMAHIDVVRLYRPSGSLDPSDQAAEAEQAPVVVYVGVTDAVSWSLAEEFVARCDNVIQSHGIYGVFVEMHHSTVTLFSPPFLLDDPVSPTRTYTHHFNCDHPGAFALTCAHVLADDHKVERTPLDPTPGVEVTFLGAYSYQNRLRDIENARRALERENQQALVRKPMTTSLDRVAEQMVEAVRKMDELEHLQDILSVDDWVTDANRSIGRAFCFPRQDNNIEWDSKTTPGVGMKGGLGFTEDWGLVKLDQDCVTPGVEVNYIPVPWALPWGESGPTLQNQDFFTPVPQVFDGDTLRVSGIAPLSDFHNREVRVLKRGARTGQTVGTLNPVKSITRSLTNAQRTESFVDTLAVTIVGLPGAPFSMVGDSGSAVIDEQGRALAMVWGGPPDRSDLTYATPVEFIFDRMRQHYDLKPSLI